MAGLAVAAVPGAEAAAEASGCESGPATSGVPGAVATRPSPVVPPAALRGAPWALGVPGAVRGAAGAVSGAPGVAEGTSMAVVGLSSTERIWASPRACGADPGTPAAYAV